MPQIFGLRSKLEVLRAAKIAKEFNFKGKRGFANYVRLVWKEFKHYSEFKFSAVLSTETVNDKALLVNVSNGSQFGNNFYISPKSNTRDGKMELVILNKFPLSKALRLGFKFFRKSIKDSKYYSVKSFEERVFINFPENTPIQIDGDAIGESNSLEINILPESLNLLVP